MRETGRVAQRAANQARFGGSLTNTYRIACQPVEEEDTVDEHYLGPMDQVCDGCGSLNFRDEMTVRDRNNFSACCQKGLH